ncbi:6834_t:CDS:2 [Scutellospora calospora]|uniref:6834_t:CDS:1 n=1 Tax=Scutellospora calospora TaxID=85575 RepID=A0ACA9KIU2_9GLOM|nr:6834_t:CDS:2 [Scutellospora calospora]
MEMAKMDKSKVKPYCGNGEVNESNGTRKFNKENHLSNAEKLKVKPKDSKVIEIVRFIIKNPNLIIEGNWFCQHWNCKHKVKCLNIEECKNKCPHEPECKTVLHCLSKWTCKHEPECEFRAQCKKRWICRHEPVCQSRWHCRKNWTCRHQIRCKDLWECKYRWTEEYEPHCQGEWQCYHTRKCQTKLDCQNKPFNEKWKCPHKPECYNKWKCQNKWHCQHKEECDMSKPKLKWKCQQKCQHTCPNEEICKNKSQAMFQQHKHQFKSEWKCRHQCNDLRECYKKWECPHKSENTPKCKDEWKCKTRWWQCKHVQPCISGCQEKWDNDNEWKCGHAPECQSNWQCISDSHSLNKWQCQNTWKLIYSQDVLKACLTKTFQPNKLYDFFTKQCNECEKKSLIMSFMLYTGPQKILKSEIICHLIWTKAKEIKGDVFYRVFGRWICNQGHKWDSSYTWISLQKFVENSLTGYQEDNFRTNIRNYNFRKTQEDIQKHNIQKIQTDFQIRDFFMMQCHECWKNASILCWQPIIGSKDAPLHDRALCEKCRSGDICVQKNSYFGRQYSY